MKYLTTDEIREKFLGFFASKGHLVLPSFPLIPHNDNSLLLINSGMAPFKPFFAGQETPPSKRVATCQKCIRTIDIEEVGKTARHVSFFEMLGNFSFGDYFKKESIPWGWEFLTRVLEIPEDLLYPSVYEEDDEAFAIWENDMGIAPERIFRLGKKDNFWELGPGPCGPCSEIYFDRGAIHGCGRPDCAVGCECDRFMEVWNHVFTQFNKKEDGSYEPLSFTNIDTGMGIERLAIVMQNADSIFEIDTLKTIKKKVKALIKNTSKEYGISINIITDHVRAVVFMASDGVLPSNEGRGYVLRRLLRRAVRHGKLLDIQGTFLSAVAQVVIDVYGKTYPSLAEKNAHIVQVLSMEENRFLETLDTGLNLLNKYIGDLNESGQTVLSGEDAFKLYDTYGFPLELMKEILSDEKIDLDEEGFNKEMENQRNRARAARGASAFMGADEMLYHKIAPAGLVTEFCGYTENSVNALVLALAAEGETAEEASEGQEVAVFLDRTPFYAESGGQKGDTGLLENGRVLIEINNCVKVPGNNTAHIGTVKKGSLRRGDTVTAAIDTRHRLLTMCNHSATHLLQRALREVLGSHVEQAGSEVGPARLRFDFTHFSALTRREKEAIEDLVNNYIFRNLKVSIKETGLDEARRMGAMALFGEKYGDTVRVVDMEGISAELCGGTHVGNTQAIGLFKIVSEGSVAAGVRRVEAVTGAAALNGYKEAAARLSEAAEICKSAPEQLNDKIQALIAENKQLKKEMAVLNESSAKERDASLADEIIDKAEKYGGFLIAAVKLEGYDAEMLRGLSDRLRDRMGSGCMMLCGIGEGGNAQFIAFASGDAVIKGIHSGQLVKEAAILCGGNGGGRPNHAQAGGKDASKADEALAAGLSTMKQILAQE